MKVFIVLSSCLVACALSQSCGGDLQGSSGTFASPNFPNDYSNNANCEWLVTVPDGESAMISFNSFSLESSTSCSYDKIEVREGNARGAILLTACGSSIPSSVVASGNIVYIKFTSDGSVTSGGFQAQYQVSSGPAPTTPAAPAGCGGNFNTATGTLASPNYPSNYGANEDCTWQITIPAGTIRLTFSAFSLESASSCNYDYLLVTDTASGTQLAKICGGSASAIEGTSNSVTLRFVSDSSVQAPGFQLSWSRQTCANRGGNCVAQGSCDGDVRGGLYCPAEGTACCFARFEQGECGVVPARSALIGGKPRIVGGDAAAEHSWPWQASLQTTSTSFHFCGASIISDRWIITAAHCVDGDTPTGLKVVTGEHHQAVSSVKEQEHAVAAIIMHESYNGNGAGFPNDIALLKLTEPIVLDEERLPICLADIEDEFVGDNCFITGWGLTQGTGDDEILNELNIDVLTQASCTSKWGSSYINPGHICLGNGLSGACNGDSGGPLACSKVRDGVTRWVLAGATSWGRSGCQTEGYPSVYSRISYFRDWIESTIRTNN